MINACCVVSSAPGPKPKKPKRSSHLSGVSSVGITIMGELNEKKFNEFMSNLLQVPSCPVPGCRNALLQLVSWRSPLNFLIEMDSDGSHTIEAVMRVIEAPTDEHFVIGSRYLPGSSIIGWPLTRRIFSRYLNHALKYIFRSELNDWTNGLRRYSAKAVAIQLEHDFTNRGFISLSEQTLLLKDHGILPVEVPITFIERVHGSSTVTYTELLDSIKGIVGIYISRKKNS